MLKTFEDLRALAQGSPTRTAAIACAHDAHTLEAALKAESEGLIRCVFIGRADDIIRIAAELGHRVKPDAVINCDTDEEAAATAVRLVREGKADFIQKGLMQTATLLKAVVNKETGIGTGRPMSHVALLQVPGYHKLLGITDGGMIPAPDLEMKKAIAANAAHVFRQLGREKPLMAALCAAESVSPKITETVDAAALKEYALSGGLGDCVLEGPISLDLAMSRESAAIKGYESPVCGEVDVLIMPTMAAGNIMAKSLVEFAGAKMAGVIAGALCPIALNSRSASFEEKYDSLMLCACVSNRREG